MTYPFRHNAPYHHSLKRKSLTTILILTMKEMYRMIISFQINNMICL